MDAVSDGLHPVSVAPKGNPIGNAAHVRNREIKMQALRNERDRRLHAAGTPVGRQDRLGFDFIKQGGIQDREQLRPVGLRLQVVIRQKTANAIGADHRR